MILFYLGISLTLLQVTADPNYCTVDQIHTLQGQINSADSQAFDQNADFMSEEEVAQINSDFEFEHDCKVKAGSTL